jgi:23S rRNA (adenine2030-N6)-methyltransferase
MLSYRHSFHAGNFADVLKHLVLIKILEYLGKKDKPYCCIDTHAGPGDYALNEDYALKNK